MSQLEIGWTEDGTVGHVITRRYRGIHQGRVKGACGRVLTVTDVHPLDCHGLDHEPICGQCRTSSYVRIAQTLAVEVPNHPPRTSPQD